MTQILTGPGMEPENKVWAGKAGPKTSGGPLIKKKRKKKKKVDKK